MLEVGGGMPLHCKSEDVSLAMRAKLCRIGLSISFSGIETFQFFMLRLQADCQPRGLLGVNPAWFCLTFRPGSHSAVGHSDRGIDVADITTTAPPPDLITWWLIKLKGLQLLCQCRLVEGVRFKVRNDDINQMTEDWPGKVIDWQSWFTHLKTCLPSSSPFSSCYSFKTGWSWVAPGGCVIPDLTEADSAWRDQWASVSLVLILSTPWWGQFSSQLLE